MEERLEKIPNATGLYYDKGTLVVYYVEKTLLAHSWCITAMTPFLGGKHGHPCRYIDGRIKEFE